MRNFFEATAEKYRGEGYLGCLLGGLGQELSGVSEVFRRKVEQCFNEIARRLATCLREAARRGDLADRRDHRAAHGQPHGPRPLPPYLETPDKLAMVKQHVCEFLEMGGGGPVQYTGRSMPDAHRGMNINEAEYMAMLDDIMEALRRHRIDEQTQKDVLGIAYSLKSGIMHV